ncbi:MAG: pectate lyase [Paludibacter sp.]|nr:pectate lyase [Paludibacter sp.]
MNKLILISFFFLFTNLSFGQQSTHLKEIDPAPFSDNSHHWYGISDSHNIIQPPAVPHQFKPEEITLIANNILIYQKNNGGWPKNYDMFAILNETQKDSLIAAKSQTNTTFDNGTTYTQIAALSIAYNATGKAVYKKAALKGLNFVLQAQYSNGGWPQYFPVENDNYSSHITYNDGAMIGVMKLLKDILDKLPQYDFIDRKMRVDINAAFEKGLDCIVKTQINENGKPNVWCQQHNEITLQPAWARKFEPPCICNKESAEIVLFLMSIKNPTNAIKSSIKDAVKWFEDSKIYNTKIETISATKTKTNYKTIETDRIAVTDSTAAPIWTRFYELETHRPMFSDRNSKTVYSLAEVSLERRVGYGWYTYDPQAVLKEYPAWEKKWMSK